MRLITCENIIVRANPGTDGPSLFGWPHFILKALYTENGLLFGKFCIGERDYSGDGRAIPVPPLHILSIRGAIKKKDHRFFQRVMEGMRPEFERGEDHEGSPLIDVDWIPRTTAEKILTLVALNPGPNDIASLVNELVATDVYPAARCWAEKRLKEIQQMESATKNIRILGQILPNLVDALGSPITGLQQITDRRGVSVWKVDTGEAGSFALKYVTQGKADPYDPVVLVRHEGTVLRKIGPPAGTIFVHAGEVDEIPYLVTRWLEGAANSNKIAKQLLQESTEPAIARLQSMTEEIVEAVARVHAAGWVHGDIQPAHIMVDPQTGVQLIDWALARREDGSEGHNHAGCLVHYAAPEIAASMLRGDAETGFNQAAEVYALCATLLFLLTGSVAVDYGDEPKEMGPRRLHHRLERVVSGKHIRRVSGRWEGTGLAKAIDSGLQPLPDDRPTAAVLLSKIKEA